MIMSATALASGVSPTTVTFANPLVAIDGDASPNPTNIGNPLNNVVIKRDNVTVMRELDWAVERAVFAVPTEVVTEPGGQFLVRDVIYKTSSTVKPPSSTVKPRCSITSSSGGITIFYCKLIWSFRTNKNTITTNNYNNTNLVLSYSYTRILRHSHCEIINKPDNKFDMV